MAAIHILAGLALLPLCLAATCKTDVKKGGRGDVCSAQWCEEGMCCGKATQKVDTSLRKENAKEMNVCNNKGDVDYLDMNMNSDEVYSFDCLSSVRGEDWGFETLDCQKPCKEPETEMGKEGDSCSAQWCGEGLCCGKATSRNDSSDVMNMCYDKQRTEYLDEEKYVTYDFDCLHSERGETWGLCKDEGSGGGCSGFVGFIQSLFGMCKSSTSDTSSGDDVRLFAVLGKPLFQEGPNSASVLLVAAAAGLVVLAVFVRRSRRRQNGFQISGAETETFLE